MTTCAPSALAARSSAFRLRNSKGQGQATAATGTVPMTHGTPTAYTYGCRCPACRAAHTEAQRVWRAGARQRTNAWGAQRHIEQLRAAGYSYRAIAELAGLGARTIRRIADGQRMADKRVEAAILGVGLDDLPRHGLVPAGMMRPLASAVEEVLAPADLQRALGARYPHRLVRWQHMQVPHARRIVVLALLLQRQGRLPGELIAPYLDLVRP